MKLIIFLFFIFFATCARTQDQNQIKDREGNLYDLTLMPDNKLWITDNLKINLPGSFCYDDIKKNCDQYGRLYTWEAAQQACKTLGESWRLPTSDEWKEMASHYGGVFGNSQDSGKTAYQVLLVEGSSGFDIVLGGGRSPDGTFRCGNAHGFYWTATANNSTKAPFYNFGKGSGKLFFQPEGEKWKRSPCGV